jgi:hypothetical protein
MNSIKQLALLIAFVSLSISVNAISKCYTSDMIDDFTPSCCDLQGGKMVYRAELFGCEFPQTPENDEKFDKCCSEQMVEFPAPQT